MYFTGKITFVNLQVSNLKLQHTQGGYSLVCCTYANLILWGGVCFAWYTGTDYTNDCSNQTHWFSEANKYHERQPTNHSLRVSYEFKSFV